MAAANEHSAILCVCVRACWCAYVCVFKCCVDASMALALPYVDVDHMVIIHPGRIYAFTSVYVCVFFWAELLPCCLFFYRVIVFGGSA